MVLAFALSACTGGGNAVDQTAPPRADPLLDAVRKNGAASVIVQLAVPPEPGGSWKRSRVERAQRELVRSIDSGVRVVDRFGRKLPQILLLVEEDALMQLRQSPLVVNITLNATDEATE